MGAPIRPAALPPPICPKHGAVYNNVYARFCPACGEKLLFSNITVSQSRETIVERQPSTPSLFGLFGIFGL